MVTPMVTETAPPTPHETATAALATATSALTTIRTMATEAADESAELRVTLGVLRTRLDAAEFDAALGDADAVGRRAALHEQLTTAEAQLLAAGRRAAEADKRAPAARAAVRDAADADARARLAEIEAALEPELAAILTTRPVDVTDEALERVGLLARQSYTLRHDLGALTGDKALARPWDFAKRLGPTLARRLPWLVYLNVPKPALPRPWEPVLHAWRDAAEE
jgi:hypothetical protein